MAVPIPESHKHLLLDPIAVALVTVMPDGQPQATPVWVDYDGTHVIVNTARGRQKDRNMKPGAKVTILSINPQDEDNWLEVRGVVVEETEEGAVDVINALSLKYRGEADFYAGNPSLRGVQQRVTYRIEPRHINMGG